MTKVLIIEDDPFVQRFYKRLFDLGSYASTIAGSGQEGLEMAFESVPDLILLDVMMPGMNGLEVLEKLKKDARTKEIPVVMLTVLSDTETVKKAALLGASGYLVKSEIDPKDLVNKVDAYVQNTNN